MNIKNRNRFAQGGPDAVVIDPGGHHQHQHLVRVECRDIDHFALHCGVRVAVAFTADGPGIHLFGNMTQRRNFADLIQVFNVRSPRV